MTTHYVSGEPSRVLDRLQREGREVSRLVLIQFVTPAQRGGVPGWVIAEDGHYWPCAPAIGDQFGLTATWKKPDKGGGGGPWRDIQWRVVGRHLCPSDVRTQTTAAIIICDVEPLSDETP